MCSIFKLVRTHSRATSGEEAPAREILERQRLVLNEVELCHSADNLKFFVGGIWITLILTNFSLVDGVFILCKNEKAPRSDVTTTGAMGCSWPHFSINLICVIWCEPLNLPSPQPTSILSPTFTSSKNFFLTAGETSFPSTLK